MSSSNFFASVHALGTYPSGSLLSGFLVAGGYFDHAGGVAANNIAYWDGTSWHPLNSGTNGEVHAVTFWDPDGPGGPIPPQLIAAGTFTVAGGVTVNGVASFDGINWHALGSGVAFNYPGGWYGVEALTTWDPDGAGPLGPQLIAGGYFDTAGGVPVNGIARWDGTQWRAMGGGVDGDPAGLNSLPGVDALTTWDPDGAGPLPAVVVAGGFFDTAGGVTVNGVARWDGTSWSAFSTGMNDEVWALGVLNGQLIAAGDFTQAGNATVHSMARWNGAAWIAMDAGLNSDVFTLTTFTPPGSSNAQIAAGGTFWQSGDIEMDYLASWDGSNWHEFAPPALNVTINAMAQMGPRMIGAGSFTVSTTTSGSPKNIAGWDGRNVSALGTGMNLPVHALKSYNTGFGIAQQFHVVAGGEFTTAGGVAANRIAIWNEGAVGGLPPAWSALGNGFNGTVMAIERLGTTIYAGGSFTASGATAINRIASWNGSAWQALGLGEDGTVNALKVYNGSLYAGGAFTHTNSSLVTGGLSRWDGSAWHVVGGTFSGTVYAMEVYNNQLVIGGDFAGISGSPNLMVFNGTAFSTLGSGGANGIVRSLCVGADGNLYIGGDFTSAGGASATSHMAKWNGSAWSGVGGGTNATVNALAPFHNEVTVGGAFTTIRGGTVASTGWARYLTDGVPWIVLQPLSEGTVCARSEASFSTRAAQGYSTNFTWRHNGVPVTLGTQPWGTILASDGTTLDIVNIHAEDSGVYDCVISNSCGSVTTIGAPVQVCPADFNCDGGIDGSDVGAFFDDWEAGKGSADVNSDGGIDGADVSTFFQHWQAGC